MSGPTYDVVVVGLGGAGAAAAIEAHDAGLAVLVVEKAAEGGGNTRESGGSLRHVDDQEAACAALRTYADAVTGEDVQRAFVEGLPSTTAWLTSLGADLVAPSAWTKGYPGTKSQTLEGAGRDGALGGRLRVAADDGRSGGEALWDVLRAAVEQRGIEVRHGMRCEALLVDDHGAVRGVRARDAGGQGGAVELTARRGVVLATGGFGADRQMQLNFLGRSMPSMGLPDGNTGDGVRLAQQAGAGLWHVSAYATVMGYDLPGVDQALQHQMPVPNYVYVDAGGNRFLDELGYDWHALPHAFLPTVGEPGAAAWGRTFVVFDETARRAGPIINATTRAGRRLGWSADNSAEIERGWIKRGTTPEELAEQLGLPGEALARSLADYDEACRGTRADAFGRTELAGLAAPPYYGLEVLPILCNTQGGPRRDARARVLDPYGNPIAGLYAAGELGSIWGKHYPGAGNVTEALVFGRIAGRELAGRTT
ncbi:FAD-dependent oxidoreductase [Nocardioides zeae]|uniref:Succinate dehydrogenase/fumarate reductase flavoprotein subunit n=1 Tax=Nocardioides zeae TaxID=1457234 RepID=A0AAJ1U1M5_9ACTN|nr:FAD-dependent oxidoreductase [Nocardioides zeae]MDQ1105704.1 succinate dehydrogenase/fumarate reductase flavoprotein subunit [Nocardioides zeae]